MFFWPRRRKLTTPKKLPIRRTQLQIEELENRSLLSISSLGAFDNLRINSQSYDTNHVLVKWSSNAPAVSSQVVPLGNNLYRVALNPGVGIEQAVAFYETRRGVEFASPDYQVTIAQTPNDPQFNSLYGMNNTGQTGGTADADIDAPEAWDITTGSSNMVVAVIDTGVDYNHQDLAANMWRNIGEIAGNGVDDDRNGFIDDVFGYDFANNDGNPMDDNGHGTHVAGTIGAVGNNGIGVAGVNWNVKIMALKFLGANGSGSLSNAVRALNYAVQMGAKVSNNSYGGGGFYQAMADAINNARANGHIFVAAAGNAASNNDVTPAYPANYNYNNVVSVAATDSRDNLASFSNYGATTVDIGAPGVGILSTTPNNTYSSYSGTSMASPHVAGAMALVWSKNPTWTYSQVIAQVLNSVDKVTSLTGKVATGGRLNLFKAVSTTSTPGTTAGPQITSVAFSGSAYNNLTKARITFNKPMNAATFTAADVVFTNPSGTRITISSLKVVTGTNNTQFDVTFATQTVGGTYKMVIGPTIGDLYGNLMDQNQNGTRGEIPGDQYTAMVTLNRMLTFGSTTKVAIPDLSKISSSIVVNQDINIRDLNIRFNISHTYDSDLMITLISPDGTRVNLVNGRGGSGDNFNNTIMDDESLRSLSLGVSPFTGAYRPEEVLSVFDGKNARGTWTLEIQDTEKKDVGSLNSWSLTVEENTIPTRVRGLDTGNNSASTPRPSVPSLFGALIAESSSLTPIQMAIALSATLKPPVIVNNFTSSVWKEKAPILPTSAPIQSAPLPLDNLKVAGKLPYTNSADSYPLVDMFSISIL